MKTTISIELNEEQELLENLNPEYFPKMRPTFAIGKELAAFKRNADTDFEECVRYWELMLEMAEAKLQKHALDNMFSNRYGDYLETVVRPKRMLEQERIHAKHNLERLGND